MRALLDVNVLVALLDRQHVAHGTAHQWLAQNLTHGWASCPLTENGCLRVLSNRRYPAPLATADVLASLGAAKSSGHCEFWPDDVSFTEVSAFDYRRIQGHQQVTDIYLLALAVRHRGRLVTFDQGIATDAVIGAKLEHLVLL